MDVGDEDKLELEDGNGEFRSYHSPSDLQYNSDDLATFWMRSVPGASPIPICMDDIVGRFCTSDSMAGSFHPMIWQNRPSSQPVVLSGANNYVATKVSGEVPGAEIGLMLPHRLTNFPVDAAFIQRAAQFSSFSDENLADMVNSFSIPHDNNAINLMPDSHPCKDDLIMSHVSSGVSLNHEDMEGRYDEGYRYGVQGVAMPVYDSDDMKLLGGSKEDQPMIDMGDEPYFAETMKSKKRKRESQGVELQWTNEERQHLDEAGGRSSEMPSKRGRNPLPITDKVAEKLRKQNSSDPLKGEYMHVRARRGQATNSHSLAERVRREKISERMRLLQDLVPSCSKITGKAVMLDEIINYVKSLQRQVEFLSMKLATVSPNLDLNLDELLPKEMLLVQLDPSTSTAYPPLHNPEPTAYQLRAPNFGNSPDVARRIITSQIPAPNLLS